MNFGPEGIGGGSFYDWIPDGEAWQFQGFDENCFPKSLDGRLMDAYEVLNSIASASSSRAIHELNGEPKVLDSAAKIACKKQQDFFVRCGWSDLAFPSRQTRSRGSCLPGWDAAPVIYVIVRD